MNSKTLGVNTSEVEVTHIDSRGLWLYTKGHEHYMPYDQFPWFQDATVRQISYVAQHKQNHLYWPDIDVDLTLDMIISPEKYPLKYK